MGHPPWEPQALILLTSPGIPAGRQMTTFLTAQPQPQAACFPQAAGSHVDNTWKPLHTLQDVRWPSGPLAWAPWGDRLPGLWGGRGVHVPL